MAYIKAVSKEELIKQVQVGSTDYIFVMLLAATTVLNHHSQQQCK